MLARKFSGPWHIGSPQRLPNTQEKEITREKFAVFLEWLSPDRERAGDVYEHLRYGLSMFFSRRRCYLADELADETINRVIIKIADEPIDNKMAYCYGVARNIYREWLRKDRPHLDVDDVTLAAKEPEEPSISQDCLDECLAKLPVERREVLLGYYRESGRAKIEMRQRLSARLKTTQTALRMAMVREKKLLKTCIQQCMNS